MKPYFECPVIGIIINLYYYPLALLFMCYIGNFLNVNMQTGSSESYFEEIQWRSHSERSERLPSSFAIIRNRDTPYEDGIKITKIAIQINEILKPSIMNWIIEFYY